ncbi:hypothetical protein VitviT2T_030612 [Vitis vinifera]|uniref:non-specific serine/threonine protein kinase n=1 Tax=Vitis vinifera TaxID=29760 RepID=A0ABY9E1G3_VITVI|nr:hypothetical protein VitviT2T_030612 [Vitis vinifera]
MEDDFDVNGDSSVQLLVAAHVVNNAQAIIMALLEEYENILDKRLRFYVAEIVIGLEYLRCLGMVYRDLKPENVILQNEGPWYELLVIPLRFELLCSTMIPISIKVSLDLVKSLYAKFIDWDNQMIDQERSTPCHATIRQ